MAKTSAAELKRELKCAIKSILEDEFAVDVIDRAKDVVFALRDFELNAHKTTPLSLDDVSLSSPDEFNCPLSKQLMTDPVLLATGQTYDRPFIQKWLKGGNRTCPRTNQLLSHTILTPNCIIRDLVHQYCRNRGIWIPDHRSDQDHFRALLKKISSSEIADQKSAAKELRLLTKRIPHFRALFGHFTDSIAQLLKPLTDQDSSLNQSHPDLQEDLITTLLNLSIHDTNKKLVAEHPVVLPVLNSSLRHGKIATRSNAAAALFTLSALDSNKTLIGESGALRPLVELLDSEVSAVSDAASAIFNLCIVGENRARAVNEGAVRVLLGRIKNGVHVDELLAILAILSRNESAVEEMGGIGAVPVLLRIIRGTCCERNKENCIAILYSVCVNDWAKLREMRAEEREYGTLSQLAKDGTSRAKRKANGILDRLNRVVNLTHSA